MFPIKQNIDLPPEKLPIFIIGAGGIVRDAHLPAYRKAGFNVVGMCDVDVKKASDLQRDFPEVGRIFDTPEAFLQHDDFKPGRTVFDVAVPATAIVPVLEKLPDGSAVLIQKPMGETLAEGRAILDLCVRKSLTAIVNFQLKYAPFSIAAKSLIEQGAVGDVYDLEIMVCVYTPWDLWPFLNGKPRLEILYHSIHYLDLMRAFAGDPYKVYASSVKHPQTKHLAATRSSIILDYDPFTQARIITNHGHNFGPRMQQSYLKIEGTKGAIHVQMGVSLNYPKGEPDRFLFCNEDTQGRWMELELLGRWFPDAFIGTMSRLQTLYQQASGDKYAALQEDFTTMRLVEAAYRSAEAGGVLFKDVR